MKPPFRATTAGSTEAPATAQYSRAAGLDRPAQTWIAHDIERAVDADQRRGGRVSRHAGASLRKVAATAAVVLAVSTGPALVAAEAPVPPTGSVRFLDYHGPSLHAVQLYLIYWGSGWTATRMPSPRLSRSPARRIPFWPALT